ncbi:non-homologous end-joining DNA ligase [Alicyclobacillus sp. ALC3]|uniref:non-homologous end-joining DNA ligase n=1 Tax=Alicyclobacillus sp. ALC3 TaxID=2796143 RepID=UPI00237833CB|nr:non-homologous end-joining DNA ligase [Alicyclobacillus sp. ALC3]WDL97229.1 non-homologous end-joining DNA ligase [Alicyclobacillus sp. ALC3]
MKAQMEIQAEHTVAVSNPDKLLWPEAGISKARYMQYLVDVSPWLLRHLQDRPITMIRYPDGVHGHSFYQKDSPAGTPEWVRTVPVWSEDREDYIHPVVIDSVASLLWLANLGCLEMHVGFATVRDPNTPTTIAFDLDPTAPGFERVRKVALALHAVLSDLNLPHVAKTSGATGLQVFIPLANDDAPHDYATTRVFTSAVAQHLGELLPEDVTLERLKKNRGEKVYVDYPQHGHNRTLIAPYSARATKTANVSAPVLWDELEQGVVPEDFTVLNMADRVHQVGDLMNCGVGIRLQELTANLSKHAAHIQV